MYELFIFLVFSFTSYSLVNMLIYFDGPFMIFDYIRRGASAISDQFGELFTCQACCSTWVSFFISALNIIFVPKLPFTPFNLILNDSGLWWLTILLDGLCGSGIVWLMFRLEDYLTNNAEEDDGEE